MTSVIYFKLKNAIQQQLVNFDGSVIQIGDVKRLIATKQGLGPDGALELTLSDPNTGDEYTDDGKVIPRNTLVLVKRTPATKFKPLVAGDTGTASQPTKAAAVEADPFGEAPSPGGAAATIVPGNEFGGDFYSEQPKAAVVNDDESKAMQSFLQGTASTWQREVRQGVMRGRGRGRGGRGAPGSGVAPEYKCPRCDAFGLHWLQDCPTQGDPAYDRKRVRPPVGIPMTRLARSQEGGLVLPDGQTGTLVANEDSFAREILGLGLMQPPPPSQDPTTTAGAAASQQQQEAVLALDNKPANLISADNLATTAATMQPPPPMMPPPPSLPTSGAGPAPKLAGEEDMLGRGTAAAAAAMPGAHLFDAYMRAALLPRGPPKFLEKAYGGAQPLSRSEFEHSQDDYRRRYNLPPIRRSRRSRSRSPGRRRRSRERERGDRSSRRSRSRSRTRDRSRERDRDRSKKTSSSRRDRSSERGSSRRDKGQSSREKERERKSSREREKEKSKSSRSRSDKEKDIKKDSRTPSVPPETQTDEEQREKSAAADGGDIGAENGAGGAAPAATTTKGGISATPTLDNSHEPELDYESSDLEDQPTAAAAAAEAENQKTSAGGADDKTNKNKNDAENDEKHGSRKPIVWPCGDKDKNESSYRHRRGDDKKKDDGKKDDKSSSRRDRDRDSTRDARTARPPSSSRRDGDRDRESGRERDRGRDNRDRGRGRESSKEKESSRRRGSSRDRKRGRSSESNGKDSKADGGGSKRERRD